LRSNALARELAVSKLPAEDLWNQSFPLQPLSGKKVASAYGPLAHYTRRARVAQMKQSGVVGQKDTALWLTPIAYSACMAPYDLGLPSPRDVCLLIDVASLQALWGPGTCPPSDTYPDVWQGGGVEFYCPATTLIAFDLVVAILPLSPCGDTI
jgi:hypothetical protein